jgi:dTDP-4-dehydrorhamnose reductase
MLGSMAAEFFRENRWAVSTVDDRLDMNDPEPFFAKVREAAPDVVINALGLIKHKSADARDLLCANAAMPLALRLALPGEVVLVHASTDCVFSGKHGQRRSCDLPDATDSYGLSKTLGETVALYPNTFVLRVSIIGPEKGGSGKGLFEWFMSQSAKPAVPGFSDHFWNGITTLEWCERVDGLLRADLGELRNRGRLMQLGTREHHSKAEMLRMFCRTLGLRTQIEERPAGTTVDRTLVPDLVCKPLAEQLAEMVPWLPRIRGA